MTPGDSQANLDLQLRKEFETVCMVPDQFLWGRIQVRNHEFIQIRLRRHALGSMAGDWTSANN
eukprot:CAMPEP_0194478674 /NCGR_PEP_ID=MMETSP0253-20130528/2040_1 /TAXON_ID=2966 /ORGANISM="Noctiluca scintillans" /LENGTH=62 /DNA_ID=CAMNT_0039317789 /DNA_START=141 /DNA_END=329 /DNA_ORIENTATION=-